MNVKEIFLFIIIFVILKNLYLHKKNIGKPFFNEFTESFHNEFYFAVKHKNLLHSSFWQMVICIESNKLLEMVKH